MLPSILCDMMPVTFEFVKLYAPCTHARTKCPLLACENDTRKEHIYSRHRHKGATFRMYGMKKIYNMGFELQMHARISYTKTEST